MHGSYRSIMMNLERDNQFLQIPHMYIEIKILDAVKMSLNFKSFLHGYLSSNVSNKKDSYL